MSIRFDSICYDIPDYNGTFGDIAKNLSDWSEAMKPIINGTHTLMEETKRTIDTDIRAIRSLAGTMTQEQIEQYETGNQAYREKIQRFKAVQIQMEKLRINLEQGCEALNQPAFSEETKTKIQRLDPSLNIRLQGLHTACLAKLKDLSFYLESLSREEDKFGTYLIGLEQTYGDFQTALHPPADGGIFGWITGWRQRSPWSSEIGQNENFPEPRSSQSKPSTPA